MGVMTLNELSGLGQQTLFQYTDTSPGGTTSDIVRATRGQYYGYLRDSAGNVTRIPLWQLQQIEQRLAEQQRHAPRTYSPYPELKYGKPGEGWASWLGTQTQHDYRRALAQGTIPPGMTQGQYQAWASAQQQHAAREQARADARGRARMDEWGNWDPMTAEEAAQHDRHEAWRRSEARKDRARELAQADWDRRQRDWEEGRGPQPYGPRPRDREGTDPPGEGSYMDRQRERWAESRRRREELARASREEAARIREARRAEARRRNRERVQREADRQEGMSDDQLEDIANNPNAPDWQRSLARRRLARRAYCAMNPSAPGCRDERGDPRRIRLRPYTRPPERRRVPAPAGRADRWGPASASSGGVTVTSATRTRTPDFVSSGGQTARLDVRGGITVRPTTGGGVTYGATGQPRQAGVRYDAMGRPITGVTRGVARGVPGAPTAPTTAYSAGAWGGGSGPRALNGLGRLAFSEGSILGGLSGLGG